MFDFIPNIGRDLHPILSHFPIALLTTSFVLVFLRQRWPSVAPTEWFLFALGSLLCAPTTVSGVVSHFPYEGTSLHEFIEVHQLISLVGSAAMLIAVMWRWRSRRAASKSEKREIGESRGWLIFAALGIVWIFFAGGTGGSLTYDHGVNVRNVNPPLETDE
jgi:uncharacterized membrane protein